MQSAVVRINHRAIYLIKCKRNDHFHQFLKTFCISFSTDKQNDVVVDDETLNTRKSKQSTKEFYERK